MSEKDQTSPEAQSTEQQVDVESARKSLIEAGYNVLSQEAFEKRLSKERSKFQPVEEQLKGLQSEYEQAQEKLRSYTDKEKSAEQLWQDRQTEWTKREKETQAALKEAQATAEQQRVMNMEIQRDIKLQSLLKNSYNPKASLLLALDQFPTLALTDNGELSYTDKAGVEITGEEAQTAITGWFANETYLHNAPHPGPSTKGAVSQAAPKTKIDFAASPESMGLTRAEMLARYEKLSND